MALLSFETAFTGPVRVAGPMNLGLATMFVN